MILGQLSVHNFFLLTTRCPLNTVLASVQRLLCVNILKRLLLLNISLNTFLAWLGGVRHAPMFTLSLCRQSTMMNRSGESGDDTVLCLVQMVQLYVHSLSLSLQELSVYSSLITSFAARE